MRHWSLIVLGVVVLAALLSLAHSEPSSITSNYDNNVVKNVDSNVSASAETTTSSETPTNENLLIFAFIVVLSGAVMVVYVVVRAEFHYLPERWVNTVLCHIARI